jgi:Family of unknown function (DUF5343)
MSVLFWVHSKLMNQGVAMPIQKDGTAPYAPPRTVIQLIDRYRNHGLTVPIDVDVLMRAGVTESLAARTLQTLKLLDLIDDEGSPTDHLEALAKATSEEYPRVFQDLLRSAYAEVFSFVDPAADTPDRVQDAFRGYAPRGQRPRMVTLFLGLCEHSGLVETAPRRTPGPKPQADRIRKVTPRTSSSSARRTQPGGIPGPLMAVLEQLPAAGSTWTASDRDTFIRAFSAMLDLVVPVDGTVQGGTPRALLPGGEQE